MTPRRSEASTLVGLDIGGTKTHAMCWRQGSVVAEATAGSANIQNVSLDAAKAGIAQVFDHLDAGTIDRVVAGAGGIDTEQDAQRLRAMIGVHAPNARIQVVHDSRLILAAGGAETGMAVILGTGSAVWGINPAGAEARAGGWGYLLGDESSGYWMGREAVRSTLRAFNREEPVGELGRLVLEANKVSSPDELIGLFHGATDRGYWAQQSPLVFAAHELGDPHAGKIIDAAVAYVLEALGDVSKVLGTLGPVVIGGGLGANVRLYQQRLKTALSAAGFQDIRFLEVDPVHGALFLAGKTDA